MDLQRSLLIGAIAILSFMLLTEWVAFKEDHSVTPLTASRITSNFEGGTAEIPVPNVELKQASDEDIPVATLPISEDAAETPGLAEEIPAGRIVQVRTGTLQLAIDLQGGDIVEIALSKHLEKLDNPDQPFVLLEQNEQRTYVAQSGLIGPSGIDKGKRAQFSSRASNYTLSGGEESLQVDLNWSDGSGLRIIKRFTFARDSYVIDVDYLIDNGSSERFQANLFGQIKRDNSADPAASSSGMGMVPFLGSAVTQPDDRFTKFSFEDMQEEPFKAQLPGGC